MTIKAGKLEKGDTVGIIAPASPPNLEALQKGITFLSEEFDLKVKIGKHVGNSNGYLAGTDKERAEDLLEMFLDNEVKAIFCACGGYGTARLASFLDYNLIKTHPKIFWGYSDITFLHTAIRQKTGLVTFHGSMPASDLGKDDVHPLTKQMFRQLLQPQQLEYNEEISSLEAIVNGKACGEITGGNLSLLISTLGTEFEMDTKGKILFIEDVNEEPRNVDRMLNQLLMAGKLSDSAGILIGDFQHCKPKKNPSLTLEEVISHYITLSGKPALKGFKIGHCQPHFSIPLGVHVYLDTDQRTVRFASGIHEGKT
ncbi:LD-carboxypeptidase [Bacillaceae bacterium Marseille-Q3522]|nr:LD-carboxypeptidase [Bacillaceae bacterium Marseille-Q3522]